KKTEPDKKPPVRERPSRPGERPAQQRPPRPGERPAQQRPPRPGERPRTGPAPAADRKNEASGVAKDDGKRKKKEKGKEKEKEEKKRYGKQDEEKNIYYRKKKSSQPEVRAKEIGPPKSIEITESIPVGDLAKKLNIKANEIIAKLMQLGVMATINQVIDAETAQILAGEYGTDVKVVSLFDETVIKHEEEDLEADRTTRPPIVTVMGHVDHGKTKLLDAIRHTNVIDQEFGGITQHIGAYTVKVREKAVTFLDTPGHEAFTTMRARGASITDIVILVVAANDGIMPQTVEALNHAKDANVPIIVAINKIDLPEANPQKVRQELTAYGLIPEEWGGTTLIVNISAKQKQGIDDLLEMVLIQAEMLELTANNKLSARGTVIESKLDPGRGAVATILVQNGMLRVGDPYVVGIYSGRVRAMFNDHSENIQEAGPSTPVEVLGLAGVPSAGDPFQVVENEKYAKLIAQKRQELKRIETAKKVRKVTLEDLNEMIKDGEVQELKIIIKGDVDGSVQALKESLEKLSTGEIRVKVVHSGTGGINESDVMLASASNAIIIGYHVRPNVRVSEIAEREKVSIKFYNIIYDVTNDVKAAMEGLLAPEIKEVVTGAGEVKQVFKISKVGSVAGSVVLSGKVERKNRLRLVRDGVVIFDGQLASLKRFKDDASEVVAGQECGFNLENFNDIKEGDAFESYTIIKITRKLE
ncbi:MAG TPA: translation initiation factor IF-2, partial [Spirochaetota bacterium]|nr:translation initiation factor IF-2 [Spirochaetota bacterium]